MKSRSRIGGFDAKTAKILTPRYDDLRTTKGLHGMEYREHSRYDDACLERILYRLYMWCLF